jgi:hypothetical protein
MEAMACKCAVVATNVGGIPDYTIAGRTAIIIPPANTMAIIEGVRTLVDDPYRLKKISENGYDHIRQFTWDRATDNLLHIIS